MLIRILFFFFLSFAISETVYAQGSDEIYTLYLIRHAEKNVTDKQDRDPELTECGHARAKELVSFLGELNFNSVYSTDFKRTRSTARPLADSHGLETIIYNHREMQDLVDILKTKKEDAVVIGHSNSTAHLAGLLVGEEIPEIDHSEYNLIFQVVVCEDQARLHILRSSFNCN